MHCQQCHRAIQLSGDDTTLNHATSPSSSTLLKSSQSIHESTFLDVQQLLTQGSVRLPHAAPAAQRASRSASAASDSHSRRPIDLLAESFVVLPGSGLAASIQHPSSPSSNNKSATSTFHQRMEALNTIYDVVNGYTDVKSLDTANNITHTHQHSNNTTVPQSPLCSSCYDTVVIELDKKQAVVEEQIKQFQQYIQQYQQQIQNKHDKRANTLTAATPTDSRSSTGTAQFTIPPLPTEAATLQLEDDYNDILEEEKQLQHQLQAIQADMRISHYGTVALEAEYKQLLHDEAEYWKQRNVYEVEKQQVDSNLLSIQQQTEALQRQYTALQRTNVYNDLFHISSDGHCGTINGQRLGRVKNIADVTWQEINGALGDVVLCMTVCAKQLGYTFVKYRLHALGSYSTISATDDSTHTQYELYGTDELSLRKLLFISYRSIDTALTYLLASLKELTDHITMKYERQFSVKYSIDSEKIGGLSVKLSSSSEENWTKAMKYLLTNLKFVLVFLSKRRVPTT